MNRKNFVIDLELKIFPDYMAEDVKFIEQRERAIREGREKKVVYISGKYTGESHQQVKHHIAIARWYGARIAEMGFAPIIPHLTSALMEHDTHLPYERFLALDFTLVERSDYLYMIPNWKDSKGGVKEHEHGVKHRKSIFYNLKSLDEFR